ncbi:aminoglycoside phosphotransferase family protein [Hymenobacter puniceus]|uniref:aminoglycoside phosphotransferase family protein n=1 Tax=Hymenobacter sp. BT190 TaxID=2763505 RepID=UPI001650E994|nr:aminoglycoside phosphotransferase family protein [Hymenobacter sp. BT190]MBC6696823.1 aminoglycoside phosphotransferase family protein [Hymenobacter sp. BT190]
MPDTAILDLTSPAFLEEILRARTPTQPCRVLAVEPLPLDNSASILVTLTAGQSTRPIGHFGLAITLEEAGQPTTHHMVLKVKPHGGEISGMLAGLAQLCGGELAEVYPNFAGRTGFQHTHQRELAVYEHAAPGLMPRIWGTHADEETGLYCVLMEYLEDVTLLNSVQTPAAWTDHHIRTALEQIAAWHARHLLPPGVPAPTWPDLPTGAYMQELAPLWTALLHNAAPRFPELFSPQRTAQLHAAIQQIPARKAWLDARPRTLIHNDLNPRNTCFRGAGPTLQLCAYDWELATYHVPVYDVVELLCFVLDADRYHLRPAYLEHYRQALHAHTGRYADVADFRHEAYYAALDFGLHRLGMYLMAHSVGPYPFLPRVVDSFFNTLTQTASTEHPAFKLPLPQSDAASVRPVFAR